MILIIMRVKYLLEGKKLNYLISNKLPLMFDIVLTKPFIILWTRYLSISMTFLKVLLAY